MSENPGKSAVNEKDAVIVKLPVFESQANVWTVCGLSAQQPSPQVRFMPSARAVDASAEYRVALAKARCSHFLLDFTRKV
jgi:hypothetical protein